MTSPARRHLERVLAGRLTHDGQAAPGAAAPALPSPAAGMAAQMQMKLVHDLRRLKEIQSIERKIVAKRQMLPDYAAWCDGQLAAAAETGQAVADEVLATIMVWRIDVGDFEGALPLIEHVLRYRLPLPARYARTAPTLIVEELADAALALLTQGKDAPLPVLERVADLTEIEDMPDEVRAKLHKAIGLQLARQGGVEREALAHLCRALELNERVGVKKDIERLERELKKAGDQAEPKPPEETGTPASSSADQDTGTAG